MQNAHREDTARPNSWLIFFGAFLFGLVPFAVIHEARLTSDVVLFAAVAMLAGLAYDRFLAHHEVGRIVGVILTVIAFAGGAVTGLLMPT